MKKSLSFLFIIVFLFIASHAVAGEVQAQIYKLQLANPSQAITAGSSFPINVMINTNSQQTINGDALITFDPAKITIDPSQVKQPTPVFYTYFSANLLGGTQNKLLISSWEESIAHPKSSSVDTLYATINATAVSSGSTSLSFDCTAGNEADSNINRASDSVDIINCNSLSPLSINIGAGPTSTPGPTSAPSATPAPTVKASPAPTSPPLPTVTRKPTNPPIPTSTPKNIGAPPVSGSAEVTVAAMGIGTILTVLGILIIL